MADFSAPASADADTLGRRVLQARLTLAAELGEKVSQELLGYLVTLELAQAPLIFGTTVSRWESDQAVPDLATAGAIARVCHVDPGWLAYGSASRAPSPGMPPTGAAAPQRLTTGRIREPSLDWWASPEAGHRRSAELQQVRAVKQAMDAAKRLPRKERRAAIQRSLDALRAQRREDPATGGSAAE